MNEFISLFTGGWGWLAGIGLVAAGFIGSYFGGKKIGTVKTQAAADVTAAKVESAQVSAVAEKQKENTEVVKDVQQSNYALSDNDARRKLQQSRFNRSE
ncbi:hypothetical protein [Erwinia sp. QL-Z3]|uniref:hypothetical protein n=1 Tax=Erwinia sp. QL-Z3 TaxID=2547962 RepID=UPI001070B19E|nr:hypothetical protein [Erwinia sp. QL-Z3]QBR52733.1 hypothetical protein E2F51_23435 [Erwinia sp. QL-Z3]